MMNLAALFPEARIVATELNPKTCEVLKKNAATQPERKIEAKCGNGVDAIFAGDDWSVVYLDPPWGGRDYKTAAAGIDLKLTDQAGKEWSMAALIKETFEKKKAEMFVLKIPNNYSGEGDIRRAASVKTCDVHLTQPSGALGKVSYRLLVVTPKKE